MIKSDFYGDYQTVVDDMIITNSITTLNITDIDADPNRAYYMGQIPGNIAPDILPSKFVVTESENPMESVVSFEKQNTAVNWGYCYSGSSGHTMTWNGTQYLAGFSLFNSLSAYKVTNRSGISIYLKFFRFTNVTLDSGTVVGTCGSGDNANYTHNFDNTADFISWVTGGTTIQLTVFGSTVDLHYADLDARGECSPSENVFVIFCGYSAESRSYYGNSTARYIYPFYSYRVNDRYFANTAFPYNRYKNTRIAFTVDLSEFRCDTINSSIVYFGDNYGFTGEREISVTGEFIDYVRRTGYTMAFYRLNSTGAIVSYTGNYTSSGVTYYQCGTIGAMDPGTLWTLYCLINKVCNTGYDYTVQYTTNHTIALFTANNTPVPGRVQFTTYPETVEKLRDWQKYGYNITDDNFDPGNPPEPTPRPDPEIFPDDENVGDDIETPDNVSIGSTLGFITQYCLNAAQISELGELLWTSFIEPDYWKNFMFSLALDTGSFNTSALLDFFISLRVYPFPLVNAPGYRAMGNNMYVGTGTVPLEFNNPLHAINSYAVIIDAGKLKIPFCFGDFRDCTNMEIILYLPYCGTVQLEANDVLGGEMHAKYCVDLATGSCTAIVDLTTWDNHKYPIAVLSGSIGADVPLSATNAGQVAARLGSDVLNTAGILISGAAGIADAAKTIAAGVVTENPLIAGAGAAQIVGTEAKTAGGLVKQGLDMVSRPGIGAPMLSGGRGFSAAGVPQKCYIQIRHPFYKKPANYDSTEANPAAVQIQVGSCSGLCSFVNPDVSSITATEEEKNQIRAQLQAGIII